MTRLIAALLSQVRASYWFVPAAMTLASLLLAAITLRLDEQYEPLFGNGILYSGGAGGARSLLSTIASSMITVAGTVFSVTIVVLALASQQFGPRLLSNFMRDRGNQFVLGTFVSSFAFSIAALRRIYQVDGREFVPHLSVSMAVLLGLASVGVLIYFIHHISSRSQAVNVIASTAQDLEESINRLFPSTVAHGGEPAHGEQRPTDTPEAVPADRTGYIQLIDPERLLKAARRRQMLVEIRRRPGDFVVSGETVASFWPAGASNAAEEIISSIVIGARRTTGQDVRFAIEQLIGIASRALSPSVNDEFTAASCLDRLASALCTLSGRAVPSPFRYDDQGELRVIAPPFDHEMVIRRILDLVRQNPESGLFLSTRFLEMLEHVIRNSKTGEFRELLLRESLEAVRGVRPYLSRPGSLDRLENAIVALQTRSSINPS